MKRYTNEVLSITTGLSVIGATVAVYLAGTVTLATLYTTNDTAGASAPNPFATGLLGQFEFYAPDDLYDIMVTRAGKTIALHDVEIVDLAELKDLIALIPAGPASAYRPAIIALRQAAIADGVSLYDGSLWQWRAGNYAAMVALDTAGGVFVASDYNPTGSLGAWIRQFNGDVDARWFGARPGGIFDAFDSAAAIRLADAVARALDRTLYLCGQFRIKTTLVISAPTHWRFQGAHAGPGQPNQGSYILKDGNLHGPAIRFVGASQFSQFDGGAVIADPTNAVPASNGGDGVVFEAPGITMRRFLVQGVAGHGFRIGDTVGAVGVNANSISLYDCVGQGCGGDAFHVDDALVAPQIDANTFLFSACKGVQGAGNAFYFNRTYLGGTLIACLAEQCQGWGLYFDANAQGIQVIGGDNEQNALGQVFEAVPRANRISGMSVQGVVWDNLHRRDTFVPTVYAGGGAAGTEGVGTYSSRAGLILLNGPTVTVKMRMTWTAHTGTAPSLYAALPANYPPSAGSTNFDGILVSAGMTGTDVKAVLSPNGKYIRILTPTMGNVALPSSGDLYIDATYEVAPGVVSL